MFKISALGDRGLRLQFGEVICPATNQLIRGFSSILQREKIQGIIEWIPTYTAISIYYDPYLITYEKLEERIMHMKGKLTEIELPAAKIVYIPTVYGGEYGPDLLAVAHYNGLSVEEVVKIHSSEAYLIYMMGFAPGFPYLGGMSKKIATPRLANPRAKIPAGSVGIAGEQTGIYSMETPGGWQVIGRTPVNLYDPRKASPILLEAGHYLKFTQISYETYCEIEEEVKAGIYIPLIEEKTN